MSLTLFSRMRPASFNVLGGSVLFSFNKCSAAVAVARQKSLTHTQNLPFVGPVFQDVDSGTHKLNIG